MLNEQEKLEFIKQMASFSRTIWGYFNYTGLLDEVWHDSEISVLKAHINKQRRSKKGDIKPFEGHIEKFLSLDVSMAAYSIVVLPLNDYTKWSYPLQCFFPPDNFSRAKKLREYCGSRKEFDRLSWALWRFYQLQVEKQGRAFINSHSVTKEDESGRRFSPYYVLYDRIKQFDSWGVDYLTWLDLKFDRVCHSFDDNSVSFQTLVNFNKFDFTEEEIKSLSKDNWREVREFLSLSSDCDFPDGYIPKGWRPRDTQFSNTRKITKVKGNGQYMIGDSSWRGNYHYMGNSNLIIKCTPENFNKFRSEWLLSKLITSKPTWEEYRDFGVTSVYNEDGTPNKPEIRKPVTFRRES
jgi:hypothetical protein